MKRIEYFQTGDMARQLDTKSIQEFHIPSLILMEHAAISSIQEIKKHISIHQSICILCGPGNNGGDGIAIARNLAQDNIFCDVYIPTADHMSKDEYIQYQSCCVYPIHFYHEIQSLDSYDIIIDCLFGNGLSRNIQGKYQEIIEEVNQSHAFVISIDLPSGIHATSGKKLGYAIQADLTIALDCFKEGHFINDGISHSNQLISVDIGIPHEFHTNYIVNETLARQFLPTRQNHSHKGSFKKALLIGGSQSMHGALYYSAKACYRSGIGTLTCMIPDCIGDIVAQKMSFAMNLRMPDENGKFKENLTVDFNPYSILAIGNGMGQQKSTIQIVQQVLSSLKPVILDADALWALKGHTEWLNRKETTILLPHIKEMTYLCDASISEIKENPFEIVRNFCLQHPNCILVLKSSCSIIGHKETLYVLNQPNSALAKGGSGDILCGIVTGLCGQTEDYEKAVVCACYIHNQSVPSIDAASVLPDECIDSIPLVFQKLRNK
ncbi:NAD(P)H-hydrate dehydratase [Floccifex sp.]|uniref:NAD(P)H-hydrate dehydratase n=1 Tax=Floccifex sp. TaxID=2815810 RepID=UPI003F0CC37E